MTIDWNRKMMENHAQEKQHEAVDRAIVRARKEVEINGGGTNGYRIKEGEHRGTVLAHTTRRPPAI